jgi:hypothetical protein
MKLDIVAGSKNDEFFTPATAVLPILPYVNPGSTIWCPFDQENSWFVRLLSRNHEVIYTHINDGVDFFEFDEPCDVIISNPPYSKKTEVFERLYKIGKPFAMLVGLVGLFESKRRFEMFRRAPPELMLFSRRISFLSHPDDVKAQLNPPFSSGYVCSGFLPEPFVFVDLPRDEKGD